MAAGAQLAGDTGSHPGHTVLGLADITRAVMISLPPRKPPEGKAMVLP